MNAAAFFASLGDMVKAERIASQAVYRWRRTLAEGDPDLVEPLLMRAVLLSERGAYAECETLLKEAFSIIDASVGDSHPCLPGVLGAYSLLLQRMGVRPGKARRMELRAARIRDQLR